MTDKLIFLERDPGNALTINLPTETRNYVAVDALLSDEALARALVAVGDQVALSSTDALRNIAESAVRAAIRAATTGEQR